MDITLIHTTDIPEEQSIDKYSVDNCTYNGKTVRLSSWCYRKTEFDTDNVFPHKLPGKFNDVLHMSPVLFSFEDECILDDSTKLQLFKSLWKQNIDDISRNRSNTSYNLDMSMHNYNDSFSQAPDDDEAGDEADIMECLSNDSDADTDVETTDIESDTDVAIVWTQ